MHLSALIPQIHQFQQIGIQSHLPYGPLEKRLMGAVAAPGDNHPVQLMLPDTVLNVRQRLRETSQLDHFGQGDVGPTARLGNQLAHIQEMAHGPGTGAGKNTGPGWLVVHISFRRQVTLREKRPFTGERIRVQLVIEQPHYLGRRAARIQNRLRYLFGGGKRAADKDAGVRGLQRREFMGSAEAVFIQVEVEQIGKMAG